METSFLLRVLEAERLVLEQVAELNHWLIDAAMTHAVYIHDDKRLVHHVLPHVSAWAASLCVWLGHQVGEKVLLVSPRLHRSVLLIAGEEPALSTAPLIRQWSQVLELDLPWSGADAHAAVRMVSQARDACLMERLDEITRSLASLIYIDALHLSFEVPIFPGLDIFLSKRDAKHGAIASHFLDGVTEQACSEHCEVRRLPRMEHLTQLSTRHGYLLISGSCPRTRPATYGCGSDRLLDGGCRRLHRLCFGCNGE